MASKPDNIQICLFRYWYMDLFSPPKGARILDLGGYVGATATYYAANGHEVVAVEGSGEFCDEFKRNVAKRGVQGKATVVHSLIEDFSQPDSFDACCCTEILNLVLDPLTILKVAHQSLKDGGLVFATVPKDEQKSGRVLPPNELESLMKEAGFMAKVFVHQAPPWPDQVVAKGVKI